MSADVDIDLADREQLLRLIQAIPARQETQEQVRRHNSGVYVTDIPYDPVNNCAAISSFFWKIRISSCCDYVTTW